MQSSDSRLVRFGVFEADLATRTLRKAGSRVRIQEQPFRVLAMLLADPGEVVTRERLQQELWPDDEYGEFDLGLNTAVKKLRQALNDSADTPRWIETIPKIGYRFLAPAEVVPAVVAVAPAETLPTPGASLIHSPRALWALIALLALAIGALLLRTSEPRISPIVASTISVPAGVAEVVDLALSPDGAWLAIVGRSDDGTQLWLRALDEPAMRALPGTVGAEYPFWSPDSASIAFFADSQLKHIDLDSGAPVTVCQVSQVRGGTWNDDGVILYGSWQGPIYRVAASGGTAVPITAAALGEAPHTHRWPVFLPDGRRFLFHAGHTGAIFEETQLYLGSLDSEKLTVVMSPSPGSVAYARDRLLSISDGSLVSRRLDLDSGSLQGEPAVVAEAVRFLEGLSRGQFSASNSGALAFLTSPGMGSRRFVQYDREGNSLGTVGEPGTGRFPAFGPDGKRLLFTFNGETWVHDLARNVGSRISTPDRWETHGLWSPDGNSVLVQVSGGTPTITPGFSFDLRASDGSGEATEIYRSGDEEFGMLTSWSHDGRYVLFQTGTPGEAQQIWALRLNEAQRLEERLPFAVSGGQAVLSPDGEWAAYVSQPLKGTNSRPELYVAAFPDSTGRVRVSPESGTNPQWAPDGLDLYYLDQDLFLNVAEIEKDSSGQARVRSNERLFQLAVHLDGVGEVRRFAVGPDGESFIVVEPAGDAGAQEIRLVMNWAERASQQ